MARGKAISVKIATPKIITALEASLAKLEADYATQEANEAKYLKAVPYIAKLQAQADALEKGGGAAQPAEKRTPAEIQASADLKKAGV